MANRIRRMSNGTLRKVTVVILIIVLFGVAAGLIYSLIIDRNKNEQKYLNRISELENTLEQLDQKELFSENSNEKIPENMQITNAEHVREVECGFISMPSNVTDGDFVDIRIKYPNGSDYIIASLKKIQKIDREAGKVILELTEEEILLLNSATVDFKIYKGSEIYATKYPQTDTMPSVSDYLPSVHIIDMLEQNPNVINLTSSYDKKKRYILEAQLTQYMFSDDNDFDLNNWEGYTDVESYKDTDNSDNSVSGLPSKYGGSIWD